jgi:predicted RNase H-like HicB family nuclease
MQGMRHAVLYGECAQVRAGEHPRSSKSRPRNLYTGIFFLTPLNGSIDSLEVGFERPMKLKVIVHEAEEGRFWAEVPAIPGCASQGETFEELLKNIYEAVEGCLSGTQGSNHPYSF